MKRIIPMKNLTALLIPLVMLAGITASVAAEKKGHISDIDAASGTMSLGSWDFTIPEGVEVDGLEVGDNVKVYFKIKSGNRGNEYIVKRVHEMD
jgi:hypothetical protein